MSLVEELFKKSTVTNSKGGQYYFTSYNANLDLFSMSLRNFKDSAIIGYFENAYEEDKVLAIANLLNLLDIRDGKGERHVFKICFRWLCDNGDLEDAKLVASYIGTLGRWDYILEGLETRLEDYIIYTIDRQLEKDISSETPSLLAKWLPSRSRKNDTLNYIKVLCDRLHINREQYRKILSSIRKKLNLIETKLADKNYDIDFEKVPTKAMLKYSKAFTRNCKDEFSKFVELADNGELKVNTKGLFAHEIIHKIRTNRYILSETDRKLYNAMWEQQKNVLADCDKNILVMADTSGSMWGTPIEVSIGLALYIAERNKGAFANTYMTFSENPLFQQVKGKDITSKFENVKEIVANTDIDAAFELLLTTAKENFIPQQEMPSHIIIISDMEFDEGVYSKGGTNFNGWKKAFNDANYELPKIIFWNVNGGRTGLPATKFDKDVAMISGFSTSILENILNLEEFTPMNIMIEKLDKYIQIINKWKNYPNE